MLFRDVAQLVARLVWDQDVAGSNPVIPTKKQERDWFPFPVFSSNLTMKNLSIPQGIDSFAPANFNSSKTFAQNEVRKSCHSDQRQVAAPNHWERAA